MLYVVVTDVTKYRTLFLGYTLLSCSVFYFEDHIIKVNIFSGFTFRLLIRFEPDNSLQLPVGSVIKLDNLL